MKIKVYTDAGVINNPGPAAIGIVIQLTADNKQSTNKKYSEFIGKTTNNIAEYQAVIFALKKIKKLISKKKSKEAEIELYSDSQLIVNHLIGRYKLKEKNLWPLFIEIWNLKQDFKKVNFSYIPREKNQEADKLAQKELSQLEIF